MAQRGRPRKVKVEKPKRPRGRPPKPKEPKDLKEPGRKPGGQTIQVLAMAENQYIRFRFATDRETYNAYHKLRSAVKRHGRDDITVHRDGHTIVVFT